MVQPSQNLNIVLNRSDIPARLPSKELSRFLRSKSINNFVLILKQKKRYLHFSFNSENLIGQNCQRNEPSQFEIIQNHKIFEWRLDEEMQPVGIHPCMTLLCFRTLFFSKLPAAFLHQDVSRQF